MIYLGNNTWAKACEIIAVYPNPNRLSEVTVMLSTDVNLLVICNSESDAKAKAMEIADAINVWKD